MMSKPLIIIMVVIALLLLGVIVFPLINRRQFNKMPFDQKIRILMKQANSLVFFKNVSSGTSGTLYYVKNKRKIYMYPWVLQEGKMLCTRQPLYDKWDYPEEQPLFSEEEVLQPVQELEKYNQKSAVKLYVKNEGN